MKKLLILAALLSTLVAKAEPACITNIVVSCMNGARFYCPEVNLVDTSTNYSGMIVLAQSCDIGPVMTFTVPGCPTSSTDIATVSWQCNSAVSCGGGEGGNTSCGTGSSFTITIPPCIGSVSVRIYSFYGCCTLTKCILYSGQCDCNQQ